MARPKSSTLTVLSFVSLMFAGFRSRDGRYIAFARRGNDTTAIYRRRADGTGSEELLLENASPLDWSVDGHILCVGRPGPTNGRSDLWVFSLADRKPRAYMETPFAEPAGAFSPDGRWLAYTSNETGAMELYVATFPTAERRVRVSSNGGVTVRWRNDGGELFYGQVDGSVVAVTVDGRGSTFEIQKTERLFEARVRPVGRPGDVSADGQRFLINTLIEDAFDRPVTLVVNWPALLAR